MLFVFLPDSQASFPRLWEVLPFSPTRLCQKYLIIGFTNFFFHESSVGSAFHRIKFRTMLSKYLSGFLSNSEL